MMLVQYNSLLYDPILLQSWSAASRQGRSGTGRGSGSSGGSCSRELEVAPSPTLPDVVRVQVHPQRVASVLTLAEVRCPLLPMVAVVLLERHVGRDGALGQADDAAGGPGLRRGAAPVHPVCE